MEVSQVTAEANEAAKMYAVIRTGGKQYRVRPGDVVEVEHLSAKGEEVTFTPVLVVTEDGQTVYGKEQLGQYAVTARLVGDAKGDKVTVLKYRPKTGYASKRGHRQLYSLIEVLSIGAVAPARAAPAKGGARKPQKAGKAEAAGTARAAGKAEAAPAGETAPAAEAE
jgi:large subunit ribosomal protein L21